METNVNEKLQKVLESLDQYSLKKFKSQLERTIYGGKGPMRRGRLENTDPVDLANRICKTYTDNDAIIVCISVFDKIGERQLAVDLRAQTNKDLPSTEIPGTSARDFRSAYRDYILEKFQRMSDCNSLLGEYVLLNQRYSKLIILDHHRSEEEREHEITSLGRKHVHMLRQRTRFSITIKCLFRPDENGLIRNVVVLQGAAGIGKTMTAKKITLDCARGDLYQDMFDYTFYINCREMNLHTEESSIAEMILKSWADKDWSREILKNPERLLFIIDGFDELRYSLDRPEDGLCTDPWEKQPVEILLNSLFRRKLLPKSYLIITTRPTAQAQLRQCLNFSRYAEILGFSEEDREEYFYKFFQDRRELAAQAFGHVKQNETLFTMCFVPVVCWIVCTVMKQQMKKSKDLTQSSKTLTSIYVLYLHMLKSQHNQSKQFINKNLKALCSLALDGIRKREILFMEDEIRKRGLDQEDSLPLFLSESIFRRDIDCECGYSFIHLSFQEFFAALFYILDEENALNSEKPDPDLKTLLESVTTSRHEMELTVRFVFGLLNKETMKDLEKFGWKMSPKIKEVLLEWVKNNKKTNIYRKNWYDKLLFDCLYEMQDKEFAKLAMEHVTKIVWSDNTKMEDMALAYCLEFCCNLKELNVDGILCAPENDEETTVEKEEEEFGPLSLTEVPCKDLAQILRKNPTLKELHLFHMKFEDTGMKLLCEGLKYCNIEVLGLKECSLTEACCQDLAQVLQENERLKVLDLSSNELKDTGMKLLCEGLQHPLCRPQQLWLENCRLTQACCQDLAQVLQKNLRLKDLNLSHNKLEDTGMKLLCEGLQHPECKPQLLWLRGCSLTEACCQDLAQFLQENVRLELLDLSSNELKDTGMKLLCEGLQHPLCRPQQLWLNECSLTEACCQDLAQVLQENVKLKVLDLSDNELKDTGMKLLCEGLQHPECRLQSLCLRNCGLTRAILEDFSLAITKNQSLIYLDVSSVELRESDTKRLHEALEFSQRRRKSLSSNAVHEALEFSLRRRKSLSSNAVLKRKVYKKKAKHCSVL